MIILNKVNKFSAYSRLIPKLRYFIPCLFAVYLTTAVWPRNVCAGILVTGGEPPISVAARSGNIIKVKQMLAERPDLALSVQPNSKRTPLHEAAAWKRGNMAQVLLAYKADVNAVDVFGNTPLHYAVMNGSTYMVKLLIANGANGNIKNGKGYTPVGLAIQRNYHDIARILQKHGFDANNELAAKDEATKEAWEKAKEDAIHKQEEAKELKKREGVMEEKIQMLKNKKKDIGDFVCWEDPNVNWAWEDGFVENVHKNKIQIRFQRSSGLTWKNFNDVCLCDDLSNDVREYLNSKAPEILRSSRKAVESFTHDLGINPPGVGVRQ